MGRASNTPDKYYSTRHAKYYCGYHFVWVPKYRQPILVGAVADVLNQMIKRIAEEDLGCQVEAVEVMPDHVHLFLVCPPRLAPAQIVKHIKGKTARQLLIQFPELRAHAKDGRLWSRSYFVSTVGYVDRETVRKYVESQR